MSGQENNNVLIYLKFILYAIISVALSAVLFLGINVGLYGLLQHITPPSEAFSVLGFAPKEGIGLWFMHICDHLAIIMLISVSYTSVLSVGLNAFNQIPSNKFHPFVYIVYTLLLLCCLGSLLLFELFPKEVLPEVDAVISLCLIALFSFFFFMRKGSPTISENLKSAFGIVLSSICCIVILYLTFAVMVLAYMLSQFLDIWNYIDLFLGSSWKFLHIILQIISHIQGIAFLGLSSGFGIFLCYRVINKFVPAQKTANFFQSAVTFWCLEFLFYAVTDEKSMRQAMIDKYDFSVIIFIFFCLSVSALSGIVSYVLNDIE